MEIKKTSLTDIHIQLGAKMADFAGYHMPISYAGIKDEHQCVREKVGMFDVSHMGEFVLKGQNARALVQRVTSNDVSKLKPGQAQYTCMPTETGGIVDDLLVYALPGGANFMLVVNASNIEKDWNWLKKYNSENVEMYNISDKTALLAVQGPKAAEALQPLTDMDLEGMKYYTFDKGVFCGIENVLVSATGYTGSGGFEIYFEKKHAPKIWEAIMQSGKPLGIQPIGLGARDTLRLEMGFCLYGNDIDETTSPLEAGLGWITKLKTTNFVGKEFLLDQKANGLERRLIAFEMIDRGIPRQGYEIVDAAGKFLGHVTSGTMSPSTGKAIGLGYVPMEKRTIGTEIYIDIRQKQLKAKVVKLPFYKA